MTETKDYPRFKKIPALVKLLEHGHAGIKASYYHDVVAFAKDAVAPKDQPDYDFPANVLKLSNRLSFYAIREMQQAQVSSLTSSEGWQSKLKYAAALLVTGQILNARVGKYINVRAAKGILRKGEPRLTLSESGAALGFCYRFGWMDEAQVLVSKMQAAYDIQDFWDFKGPNSVYPHHARCMMVLALKNNESDFAEALSIHIKHDELMEWILANWRTDDLETLGAKLHLVCVRHTHQSRPNSNKKRYEFSLAVYDYDISEVLAVLRLRQIEGLPLPEVDHPLMNTKLGSLIDCGPPDLPVEIQASLQKADEILEWAERA